jgi:hypothetical protein
VPFRALSLAVLAYVVAVAVALSVVTLWESRYVYVNLGNEPRSEEPYAGVNRVFGLIERGCEPTGWDRERPFLYWRCPRFRLP